MWVAREHILLQAASALRVAFLGVGFCVTPHVAPNMVGLTNGENPMLGKSVMNCITTVIGSLKGSYTCLNSHFVHIVQRKV
jgi:hypothetical protein